MNPTTVNTIEVSALCDNTCAYCPAPLQSQHRAVGLMGMDTFRSAARWVAHFTQAGTQREVNLHGVGEPTLNPLLPEMIRELRSVFPGVINFNTNGNNLTEGLATACRDAGVTSIQVTGHRADATMRALRTLRRLGIQTATNQDFAASPNNWAGQVDWTDVVDYRLRCDWLLRGQVMITWDGLVTRCCLDAFGAGVFADVEDDITTYDLTRFELCERCHHDTFEGA